MLGDMGHLFRDEDDDEPEQHEPPEGPQPERFDGSDLIVVTGHRRRPGERVPAHLRVDSPHGDQVVGPIPDEFVDTDAMVIDVEALAEWFGLDPAASPRSSRDGLGALIELRARLADRSDVQPSPDAGIKLPLVDRRDLRRRMALGLGLHPGWDPSLTFDLGRWSSVDVVPEAARAWMADGVERPPPAPAVGDTDAWPDTVEEWLADLDVRLRFNPTMKARDYRYLYVGDTTTLEELDDPLDPAMEEALRIRQVPGALPPPEGLPPARSTSAAGPPGEEDAADLPAVAVDNRVAILDRPDAEELRVPFAGRADAVRRMWEELLREEMEASPHRPQGCRGLLRRWIVAIGIATALAMILLILLLAGVFDRDDAEEADEPPPATAGDDADDAADDIGVVPLDEYADEVCRTLETEVRAGSDALGAALEAAQGAQPATPEEFAQLYADIEAGARSFAAGLMAASDALADGPVPDVDGGPEANEAAAETYADAAAAAERIAEAAAGIGPEATAAEIETIGVVFNEALEDLNALGTEFDANPAVAEAVEASEACAESGSGPAE